MRIRFQADADLDGRIVRGLRRLAPEIDIRSAHDAGFRNLPDLVVLRIAAADGRVLVSQDRRTMPMHFGRFVRETDSAGVILVRAAMPIATTIEELVTIWHASEPEEWLNRLVWIPL